MDFKKLFRIDDKAVSPVIGVILMVAITVILAAAIGSSVFSHGAAQAAPQANLNIKPAGSIAASGTSAGLASVNIEHLGGDPVNFATSSIKIMASVNGGSATQIYPGASPVTMNVGDIQKLDLKTLASSGSTNLQKLGGDDGKTLTNLASGDVVNLKFIDVKSGQIFLDKNVAF
ncbi:MAG TPA: type IV pilin [Methanosarcina sp.]|jgi:flagellin-like protein